MNRVSLTMIVEKKNKNILSLFFLLFFSLQLFNQIIVYRLIVKNEGREEEQVYNKIKNNQFLLLLNLFVNKIGILNSMMQIFFLFKYKILQLFLS